MIQMGMVTRKTNRVITRLALWASPTPEKWSGGLEIEVNHVANIQSIMPM